MTMNAVINRILLTQDTFRQSPFIIEFCGYRLMLGNFYRSLFLSGWVFQEKTLILKQAAGTTVVAKPDLITINNFECLRTRSRNFYFNASGKCFHHQHLLPMWYRKFYILAMTVLIAVFEMKHRLYCRKPKSYVNILTFHSTRYFNSKSNSVLFENVRINNLQYSYKKYLSDLIRLVKQIDSFRKEKRSFI